MTKTWMAESVFAELHQFYSWAEKKLNHRFFYPQSIYRPFLSAEEQNEWMGKTADQALRHYIQEIFLRSRYGHQVNDPFGGLLLKECGYLDVMAFLKAVKNKLLSSHAYVSGRFDEVKLRMELSGIRYDDFIAKKIIFCNGTAIKNSSFGSSVPVRPLKGETLVIETPENLELIYNRGVYMVPMREINTYKVGATYDSKFLTADITSAGREELQNKLYELLNIRFKIISQDWGFRPTTPDRKPILGMLPGNENVVIFNGLGTKGVSLAPYFSGHLLNWLLGEGEIQSEVNINRFKSLFSKSTGAV